MNVFKVNSKSKNYYEDLITTANEMTKVAGTLDGSTFMQLLPSSSQNQRIASEP